VKAQAKNFVGLLAALAVAGGLGLYAYYGVMRPGERAAEKKAVDEQLFAVHAPGEKGPDGGAPAAVFTRMTVTAKGDTTVLEKRADGWYVTSPIETKADEVAVNQLVGQLTNGRVQEKLEEKPTAEDLRRYGLSPPAFVVKATAHPSDPSRQKELTLEGGIENTFDRTTYLRRSGDEAVYSAGGGVRWGLEKSTFELRDKAVLAVDERQVTRIELKKNGALAYVLDRTAGGWQLSQPIQAEADPDVVRSMLEGMNGEKTLSFLKDGEPERKAAGLDKPLIDATFTLSAGAPLRLRMTQGKEPTKSVVLREQEGSAAILAELSGAAPGGLDKTAADLRDKTLVRLDREAVAKLAFLPAGGGTPVELEKLPADAGASEDWRVVSPERGPAKKWKVSSLLWTLATLKGSAIAEDRPKDWSKYGLDDKARTARAYDASGKLLAELRFGSDVKGKPNTIYARGARDIAYQIDTSRLGELPSKVDDVIDKPAPLPPAPALDGGLFSFPE
jgi:hypothetical protein